MHTKNALGNLKNRYVAVLKKCNLINIFGSLAVATLLLSPATSLANALTTTTNPHLENNGTLTGAVEDISGGNYFVGMFGYNPSSTTGFVFTNYADALISINTDSTVYGMYAYSNASNKFLNSGTIDIKTTNGAIYAFGADGNGSQEVSNDGIIKATSDNGIVYALFATGNGDHVLTNKNEIHSKATNGISYGMYAYSANNGNHQLTNDGLIKSTSENASAYGMAAIGNGDHVLTNTDTIEVLAIDGTSYGMYAYSESNGNHTFINSGTIISTSENSQDAYGMNVYTKNESTNKFENSGSIIVTSTDGYGYGIRSYIEDKGDQSFINNGTIKVQSRNDAFGINVFAYNDGDYLFNNNGTIKVTSEYGSSYGIQVLASGKHTVTNNGEITVTATETADNAYGVNLAYSTSDYHTITNSGIINATAAGSYNNAYGIYLPHTNTAHVINNTGIINATSSNRNAYEIFSDGNLSIETYATTLRDWKVGDAVLSLGYNDEISFDNSTLILRPGTIEEGFEYGKQYNVANMVVIYNVHQDEFVAGKINGSIVSVKTEVPFLTANLDNTDPTKPQVSISKNVTADTVSPAKLIKLNTGNIQNKVTRMANRKINKMIKNRMAKNLSQVSEKAYEQGVILAGDMITSAPSYQENKWAIYLDTYAGYTGNSEYNYGTHSKGMTLGGEKAISDKFNVGFAMDFSDSTTDGQDGLIADSTDITLAANADYFINKNWYVSGTMALSFGENDMDYMISPTLYAKDDFNSQAFYMSVNTGYIYEINQNNIIVPEFGLSYLSSQNDDIDVDFAGSDIYDMHIKNDSFSALYANLMVTWQGEYNIAQGILRPSAGLGIRQNLTGSDFDSSVQVLGSSFDTVVSEDNTTFLTNLGLEWQNNSFSLGLSYSGAYGSEQKSHSASVNFKLEF